jgi:23S rRNA (uracil1939-C5)-methyltransferase
MTNPPTKDPEIQVTISALASGGSCVGTITSPEEHRGKKAFIPYTLPGEEVVAVITHNKKSFVNASLSSIKNPSPDRVTPVCPVFGQCGGCDLQHVNLATQRSLKTTMVEDLLRIHGGITVDEGVAILAPDLPGLHYRRRMSFHLNKKGEFGLYRKHARSIVEITQCPISTPAINHCLEDNLDLFRECAPEIETVTIEDHDEGIFIALEIHPRNEQGLSTLTPKSAFKALEKKGLNLQVNYRHKAIYRTNSSSVDAPPVGHFSQNNRLANDAMIDYIRRNVTTPRVTDLYSGSGNISIPLAMAGHTVTAVELDPYLVNFGRSRSAALGISDRLTFFQNGCEKWLKEHTPDTTVVLDPPRSGALEPCQLLSPSTSPSVIYVSCYPPTFARDVQALAERGYKLKTVHVLDMFPQTYHSELVALISAP